jgi:hypothetical protein
MEEGSTVSCTLSSFDFLKRGDSVRVAARKTLVFKLLAAVDYE